MTTSVFGAASGIDATSRSRSHSETAITAAAPCTTRRAGAADEGVLGQIGDVLAVRGDDERRARRTRREQRAEPGRKEEVGVDDVGPEPPRRPHRTRREPRVTQLAAAAPVEHDPLELVPARRERALESLDEDAEIGRRSGRIHLGNEQDAHRRII